MLNYLLFFGDFRAITRFPYFCFCQKRPVPFSVHAVVTKSDLEFDVSSIDFGHCTIYEAVSKSIRLTNHSMLPQEFGFVGLPEVDLSYLNNINSNELLEI